MSREEVLRMINWLELNGYAVTAKVLKELLDEGFDFSRRPGVSVSRPVGSTADDGDGRSGR